LIRTILVPLDNSKFGEHALPLALELARRAGATLQLAHVHEIPADDYTIGSLLGRLEEEIKADDRAYLDKLLARVGKFSPVKTTPVLLDGDTAEAIRDHVHENGIDLVVMTTHGRGALGRFWFGSIADELVRSLNVPLLLVRPHDEDVNFTAIPTLNEVLIPLDGSTLAEQAIEPAVAVGTLCDAAYTLVRVVKPVVRFTYYPEAATLNEAAGKLLDEIAAHQKEECEAARAYLEKVAQPLRDRSLRVQTRVLVEEEPAAGIVKEARLSFADLVAVATHGRGGLSRLLLGSVADKLVRGSGLPVLVCRPKATGREAKGKKP
jgi:nucleotide-binding universal stress UspA family protein